LLAFSRQQVLAQQSLDANKLIVSGTYDFMRSSSLGGRRGLGRYNYAPAPGKKHLICVLPNGTSAGRPVQSAAS
jgi:hypothetical protein